MHKHKHEMTLKFGPARTDSVIIAGTLSPSELRIFNFYSFYHSGVAVMSGEVFCYAISVELRRRSDDDNVL